ncbi:MAG TPA: TIR domain-containing protein [Bryobacteraceae bacterium]|nr:TIR domain-containing protein [Bryobacteraceae bacterium]
MPLRLYISHASEDQARVNQLRDELKAKEFHVFLCEDLPAGSDWQKEIDQELKQTDVFVYCLSSASVARSGQYNNELKAARARYRTEGEQAILIVPLRLESCVVPPEVKDLMALDLFPADGLSRLLEFLGNRAQAASRYVFLLHGIKTRGKWQKDVSPLLSAQGLIPVPLDFGNFGARQLVWPPARKKKLQWLLGEYTRECDRLRCQSPSIVAHSFGCYLVASFLKKYSQVRFDSIIFCGSIVHPAYPWATLAARGQVKSVLNQYGGEDFWAWVVQWAVEDAGPSGYSGFGESTAMVHQQNHPEFAHSDYFFDLNYNQNWIPFLLGKPLPAVTSPDGGWQAPVNWRFRFVLAVGLLLCVTALLSTGWYFRSWLQRRHIQVTQSPQDLRPAQASAPQSFSGFVQDDSGAPLPGVTVTAPTLNVPPQRTDQYGRFSFRVELPAGTNFRVIFEKPGFETYSADPPAGDTTFNIPLHKVPAKRSP